MSKISFQVKLSIYSLLVLGASFIMMGCATVAYQADFNNIKQPQMSLPEAYQNIKHDLQTVKYNDQPDLNDIQVTSEEFSFTSGDTKISERYDANQNLAVTDYGGNSYVYLSNLNSDFPLCWQSQGDAKNFVDAVMAVRYYTSKQFLTDDATAFADFQQKADAWRALPQKPPLPEEVHRFIVLKDDAIQNNDFDKAADYYERGLDIDPMWPAGQYNVALIYEQLKFYPMAIMHMKRYLALEPDAKDARADQDKIYLWEEKAKEGEASSDNSNAQTAK